METGTSLIVKLIEQTSNTTNAKIEGLSNKIDNLEEDFRASKHEHKEHEDVAFNMKYLLEGHLKSDAAYQDSVDRSLQKIADTLHINTESLLAHMKRTDVLEKMHLDNKTRIENLEAPVKAKEIVKKYVFGIIAGTTTILTLAYYIIRLFNR
jgi:dGTP triphosphohydrolase